MALLQLVILALVVISGTVVVFTRGVASQPIVVSLFGMVLALMFTVFQAPDGPYPRSSQEPWVFR